MKAVIVNFRGSRRTRNFSQIILKINNMNKDKAKELINKDVIWKTSSGKEIKGKVACPGKAKGRVKIINTERDMYKFQEGDIIVSINTTPSMIAILKKCAAIVTNDGGITCHASIISRELNKPCIIGTKIATKVLKDGDLIEVDANKGVIKRL